MPAWEVMQRTHNTPPLLGADLTTFPSLRGRHTPHTCPDGNEQGEQQPVCPPVPQMHGASSGPEPFIPYSVVWMQDHL